MGEARQGITGHINVIIAASLATFHSCFTRGKSEKTLLVVYDKSSQIHLGPNQGDQKWAF